MTYANKKKKNECKRSMIRRRQVGEKARGRGNEREEKKILQRRKTKTRGAGTKIQVSE